MKFKCIHCGQSLEADSDMAGITVECPACSKEVRVPILKDQPIKVQRPKPPPVPPQPVSDATLIETGLQPRSYFVVAAMIFGVIALPYTLLMVWFRPAWEGISFGTNLIMTIPEGLMFGIVFGLVGAAFLKGATITVNVGDRDEFISRVNVAMSQIGFYPDTASGNFFTFKHSLSGFISGKLSVVIKENKATIVGPAMHVKKLKKRLDNTIITSTYSQSS